jgi:hypothetical protein
MPSSVSPPGATTSTNGLLVEYAARLSSNRVAPTDMTPLHDAGTMARPSALSSASPLPVAATTGSAAAVASSRRAW